MTTSIATAPLINIQRGSSNEGTVSSSNPNYYVKFILQEPSSINVTLKGIRDADADVKLVKPDGSDVDPDFKSINAGLHNEFIDTAALDSANGVLKPGTYYVKVFLKDSASSIASQFSLEVQRKSASKYRAYMVNRAAGASNGLVYYWDFSKNYLQTPTHTETYLYGLTNNAYYNYSPAVGDFNQDGNPDVVFRSMTTGDNYVNYAGGASNLISNFVNGSIYPAGTGDFNGDGFVDIVWMDNYVGAQYISYMGGTGGVVVQSTVQLTGYYVSSDYYLAVGDVDGNGTPDLIWTKNDGSTAVYYMDGATVTSVATNDFPKNFGAGKYVVGVADVDSDGYQDFAYTDFNGSYFWGFGANGSMSTSRPNLVALPGAPGYQFTFPGFIQDNSLVNQFGSRTLYLEYGLPNPYSNTAFVQYNATPADADVDTYRVVLTGGTLAITSNNSTLWSLKNSGGTVVATGGMTVTTGSLTDLPAGTYRIIVEDSSTTTTPKAYTLNVSRSTVPTPTTTPVKSIFTGNAGSNVSKFVKLPNGKVLFSADSPDTGRELYVTDGTTGGTTLLKDIYSGAASSSPSDFVLFGTDTAYFTADDGTNGRELWKTDGTANGTVLVKNLNTVAIPDTTPALNQGSDASDLTVVNGVLYFSATDGTNGQEPWKSDGTSAGTVMIKDLEPGAEGSYPYEFTRLNGTTALFGATTTTNGNEIYKTDGSSSGTSLAFNIQSGAASADVQNLVEYDGRVFAIAKTPSNGIEVIRTDSTASSYTLLDINSGTADSNPSLNYAPTVPSGPPGTLFVAATGSSGTELYKITSNSASPVLVKDINTSGNSNPSGITTIGNFVYFSADDGVNGNELWRSDGTSSGTVRLSDINPTGSSDPFGMTLVGTSSTGEIYFTASNKPNLANAELWKYTISTGVVSLAKEIVSGDVGGTPANLIPIGSDLLIVANDGSVGAEPMKFTVSGSTLTTLKDISNAQGGRGPRNYFTLGTQVYFQWTDTLGQTKTFKTDGTDAGTEEVTSTSGVYDPGEIIVSNNVGYTVAFDPGYGYELYKVTGSGSSIQYTRLSDIVPGADSTPISNLEPHNDGYLYFTSYDSVDGEALMRTNGSTPTKVQTFTTSSDFPSRQVMSYPERNALYEIAYDNATADYQVWEKKNADSTASRLTYQSGSRDFVDATLNSAGKGVTWSETDNGTPLTLGKGKFDHLPTVSFQYRGFLDDLLFINGIAFNFTDSVPSEPPSASETVASTKVWIPFKYWSNYSAKVDCDLRYNDTRAESKRTPFLNDYAIYKNAIYFASANAAVDYEAGTATAKNSIVYTGYEPVGKQFSSIYYVNKTYLNPTNPALKSFNGIKVALLFPADCQGCPTPAKPTDADVPKATQRHPSDINRQNMVDALVPPGKENYGAGAYNFVSLDNGYVVFIADADELTTGSELYAIEDSQSDDAHTTDFNVRLVSDIQPGYKSSYIRSMTKVGNLVYFIATTDASGDEVYVTNGLSATKLTNIPNDTEPQELQVVGNTVYFTYWDAATKSMKLERI